MFLASARASRKLDCSTIGGTMDKLIGFAVTVFLVIFFGYQIMQSPKWPFIMWGGIIAICGAIFYLFIFPRIQTRMIVSKSPPDGPMKVNITTAELGRGKHRMYIDVVMSQKDHRVLKQIGMQSRGLFTYPEPSAPDIQTDYRIVHLFNTPYVDFPDSASMDRAKAELIEGLQALRTHLDGRKEGPQRETLEI